MTQTFAITPEQMKIVNHLGEAFPVNDSTVHVVNHNWLFQLLFNLGKQFMSERRQNMFIFHENPSELMKHLEPEHIPDFLGGKLSLKEITKDKLLEIDSVVERYWQENRFDVNK